MSKERLDVLITNLGLFGSREAAKRAIMAGIVLVDNEPIDKPGSKVSLDAAIRIKGQVMPYVSRGGYKLEQAIKTFNLDLTGQIIMDIGASTGGFTDCALQNGAVFSYAIDVGYNQLAWKLRQDDRVLSMERTNFRHMQPGDLKQGIPTFACMDVSFISIKLLLPVVKALLAKEGEVVALIKPQFEAGKDLVGKKGIIRDASVHLVVIKEIVAFIRELGFIPLGLTYSPIKGGNASTGKSQIESESLQVETLKLGSGNIEFLLHFGNNGVDQVDLAEIEAVVKEAHRVL